MMRHAHRSNNSIHSRPEKPLHSDPSNLCIHRAFLGSRVKILGSTANSQEWVKRERERQTDGHPDSQTARHTDRHKHTQPDRQTETQTHAQTDTRTDRHTHRQTLRHTQATGAQGRTRTRDSQPASQPARQTDTDK